MPPAPACPRPGPAPGLRRPDPGSRSRPAGRPGRSGTQIVKCQWQVLVSSSCCSLFRVCSVGTVVGKPPQPHAHRSGPWNSVRPRSSRCGPLPETQPRGAVLVEAYPLAVTAEPEQQHSMLGDDSRGRTLVECQAFFRVSHNFSTSAPLPSEPAGYANTNHSTSLKLLKTVELLSHRHKCICSSSQTVPRSKARDSSRPLPGTGTSHAPPRRGLTEAGAAHPRTQISKPCSTTDSFSPCWSVIAGGPDFRHTTNPGNWRRHDSVSFA